MRSLRPHRDLEYSCQDMDEYMNINLQKLLGSHAYVQPNAGRSAGTLFSALLRRVLVEELPSTDQA